jgi:iron-sulfur cluster repair protein YtfE (RIC family)
MGIQDDLFDVQDAIDKLEDEGLEEAFDRLTTFYGHLERLHGEQAEELQEIKDAFKVFKRLLK